MTDIRFGPFYFLVLIKKYIFFDITNKCHILVFVIVCLVLLFVIVCHVLGFFVIVCILKFSGFSFCDIMYIKVIQNKIGRLFLLLIFY